MPTLEDLRDWDRDHVWHPFTPLDAYATEAAPIIESAEGFELIDIEGRRYWDGISSLWCNVHGHRVPEIDAAIRDQLDRVAHTTLLGLSSAPSIELARLLAERSPGPLSRVFYSDSGATAVEAALKIAVQHHAQASSQPTRRDLFISLSGAYHGDTLGSISVGPSDAFHRSYQGLMFPVLQIPSPVALRRPPGMLRDDYIQHCFDAAAHAIERHADRLAAVIVEPLVQGAAGILTHPAGYLRHLRELTRRHGVLLIADEVAVGFGRTGTLFACEQEQVEPDLMCLAKGLSGGYLPLAATLATEDIARSFGGPPAAGRTFFHGHTFTGNPLGCAAALASWKLFDERQTLSNVARLTDALREDLSPLAQHPHVAEIRQRGIMVGIELVRDRETLAPFSRERRMGHRVTLAARRRGVIIRPLGDVIVLMPAPGMPVTTLKHIIAVTREAIDEATRDASSGRSPYPPTPNRVSSGDSPT